MDVKQKFEHIQLADTYTQCIVFGFIRGIGKSVSSMIPNIIYELCVSFYYAGEHFAWRGYEMWIDSVDDRASQSLLYYNNLIRMTSDTEWNTCYGQVAIDTNLKIDYMYQWVLQLDAVSVPTLIGFGISSECEQCDDAFWVNSSAKYYAFNASINSDVQTLTTLSSASSSCLSYDRYLSDTDQIKLIFNVKKRTLQCILNSDDKKQKIIVHNIETSNKAKYHLAISMCGKYNVRLFDFKRIKCGQSMVKTKELYKEQMDGMEERDFGSIEIGILSKEIWVQHHTEEHLKIHRKVGDVLTLANIICDFQVMKSRVSRKLMIADYAKNTVQISEFESIEEVYGLVEMVILNVIRQRYMNNIIMQNYYKQVTEFVEWIFYDDKNMDAHAWPIDEFAEKFDDWITPWRKLEQFKKLL